MIPLSLTSHLKDPTSLIGQFIKRRFVQTALLTKVANQQLKNANTICPIQVDKSYPYPTIGTAIDYRIRYAFAITPYQQLVAWQGALYLTVKPVESDDDILVDEDELVDIFMSIPVSFNIARGVAQGPYPLKLVRAFFDSLDTTLNALQPVGRRLDIETDSIPHLQGALTLVVQMPIWW
jgi:hypothetical protein